MNSNLGTRRFTIPKIVPGKSITRFHLVSEFANLQNAEIHISHYPDGDLQSPAQWYGLYEQVTNAILETIKEELKINRKDWKVVETLLGNFKWVVFEHPTPENSSRICVDVDAMKRGEWSTTYF